MANQSLFIMAKANAFVEDWMTSSPSVYYDFMLCAKRAKAAAEKLAGGADYPSDYETQYLVIEINTDGTFRVVAKTHFEYKECHVILL